MSKQIVKKYPLHLNLTDFYVKDQENFRHINLDDCCMRTIVHGNSGTKNKLIILIKLLLIPKLKPKGS